MQPLKKSPRFFLPVVAVLALLLVAGCLWKKNPPRHCERSGIAFGTVARLSADGGDAEGAVTECFGKLASLSSEFDAENPENSITRLNAAAGTGEWVALSPEVWHILSVSQAYSERTGGAWDATVAPLSALWRDALADGVPPSEETIAAAREKVDWKKLELRNADKSARLTESGMALDLGGAKKGFALDECRRIYAKHHVTGLIDLGESSIAAIGEKSGGAPFRIALRHPREAAPARLGVLPLKNAVLSSSGDYEHFFISGGIRFHHILDPRTGRPAKAGAASVFVRIASDEPDAGLVADILSTALFVSGAERGLALLPTFPVHAEAAFADGTEIFAQTKDFLGNDE